MNNWFNFSVYIKFSPGFTISSKCCRKTQVHNFVSCKFHVRCNLIATKLCFQNIFHLRSKLLNETHISLNEDVFPLNNRVKHL